MLHLLTYSRGSSLIELIVIITIITGIGGAFFALTGNKDINAPKIVEKYYFAALDDYYNNSIRDGYIKIYPDNIIYMHDGTDDSIVLSGKSKLVIDKNHHYEIHFKRSGLISPVFQECFVTCSEVPTLIINDHNFNTVTLQNYGL